MKHAKELLEPTSHIGVSGLRRFNARSLRELGGVTVIHSGPKPTSVMIPYRIFMAVQEQYQEALKTVIELGNPMKAKAKEAK